jgi:antirestriction protein ArdC
MTQNNTQKRDLYQEVTDSIVQLLETHASDLKFERPWISMPGGYMPHNAETFKNYRGLNLFTLSLHTMSKQYHLNGWLTFKQVKKLGGQVKKGEKAVPIIFWDKRFFDANGNKVSAEDVDNMSPADRAKLTAKSFLQYHLVFNVCQTTGLKEGFYESRPFPTMEPLARNTAAEQLIHRTGAEISFYGEDAYYSPSEDKIVMPLPELFKDTEPYYSVLLHELCHWTGHASRLNRKILNKSGSEGYAFEELVAELGSAYLCVELGFTLPITQNAAYIKSWLTSLKNDKTWIFKAASLAERAATYISTSNVQEWVEEPLSMYNH